MEPEFQVGDRVLIEDPYNQIGVPQLMGRVGVVSELLPMFYYDDETEQETDEIDFYEYEVEFETTFTTPWSNRQQIRWNFTEENLVLQGKKERKQSGFSKFIQKIEGTT